MGEPDAQPPGVKFNHPCAGKLAIYDHDKALVEEFCPDGVTPRTKVAIVGYAESSRMQAPFDDPTFSVWGMNQLYRHIPRADRWFEIHHNWHEHVVEGTDHLGWLKSAPIPIYMVERVKEIPQSVTYPIDRIIAAHKDYFTSSIAYMIALALTEGFKTIHLYGIDLVVGDEWDYQKPNAEFWIGVAHGMGVTVGIPRESALCKQTWRYGYQSEPDSLIKITEIRDRRTLLTQQRNQKMIELANLDGALQDVEMFHELALLRIRSANVQLKPK